MATKTKLEKLLQQAQVLFEKKQYKELIALLSDEVLDQYKSVVLFLWRARAHDRLDETDNIFRYANKAIELDPSYATSYLSRGNAWRNKGDEDKAIADYTKAIELKPDYANAYYNRGICYGDKPDYDRAIADYTRAIELKPDFAEAYHNRGSIYDDKADYDHAIADYTKAIELKPDYAGAYNNRGVTHKNKDDYDRAIADYTKAIEVDPKEPLYHRNFGEALFALGKYPEALAAYEKAVELDPENTYYQSLRDKTKAKLGEAITPSFATTATLDNTANTASYIEQLLSGLDEGDKKQIRMAWVDVDEVIERIRKLLLYTGSEPVVHYTRIKVGDIVAMSKGSRLRYSNVVFMNDPEEGEVFLEHLADDDLVKAFRRGDKHDDNNIYLGSFLPEDKRDYLIMWRTYGKNEQNEEATGCSFLIKADFFDREGGSLYAEAGKTGPSKQEESKDMLHSQPLYKVVYYDKALNQLVMDNQNDLAKLTKEINAFKQKLRVLLNLRVPNTPDSLEPKNAMIDGLVYRFISELRYFFKSAEYQFEKELRVIKYYLIESPRVIPDKDGVEIPRKLYIESTKELQPFLSTITLGPKVAHPERYMYLEAQLKKNSHNTRVIRSELGYQ